MILTLNIVAIINLLLLSSIFFLKRGNKQSNILLSIILITPMFAHVFNALVYEEMIDSYRFALLPALLSGFLCSPSIYFYVLFDIHSRKEFKKKDIFHLIPAFVSFLFFLYLCLLPERTQALYFQGMNRQIPTSFVVLNAALFLQMIIYLILASVTIYRYNKKLKHLFSYTNKLSASWLRQFILLFILLYLLIFIPFMVSLKSDYLYIYFPVFTCFIYIFVIYKTIAHPIIFTHQEENMLVLETDGDIVYEDNKELKSLSLDSHNSSLLDENAIKLETYMEQDKPYLDSELNIKMLSEKIGISVHSLSETINKKYQKSFFDFINEYRVQEAQKLLFESDLHKYTQDTISLLSGFGSRSSFYFIFKKITGKSPGDYQKTITD